MMSQSDLELAKKKKNENVKTSIFRHFVNVSENVLLILISRNFLVLLSGNQIGKKSI